MFHIVKKLQKISSYNMKKWHTNIKNYVIKQKNGFRAKNAKVINILSLLITNGIYHIIMYYR